MVEIAKYGKYKVIFKNNVVLVFKKTNFEIKLITLYGSNRSIKRINKQYLSGENYSSYEWYSD